jgi:hypothetical protein
VAKSLRNATEEVLSAAELEVQAFQARIESLTAKHAHLDKLSTIPPEAVRALLRDNRRTFWANAAIGAVVGAITAVIGSVMYDQFIR